MLFLFPFAAAARRLTEMQRARLVCVLLILSTSVVYWPVGGFDFVNYDDLDYVAQNPRVQAGLTWEGVAWAFRTGTVGNWHPVTWLSHMLDCQIFGLKAGWHHLVNLLLHLVNTTLLFLLWRRMTGALWRSAFVAAVFALHPLHVESVAWVSERKDVLSALFWLLTTWAYVRYVGQPGPARYALTLLFFALGLMTKPMLVTVPFVLLLLDYWPLARWQMPSTARPAVARPIGRRSSVMPSSLLLEKIPFIALAAGASVVTFLAQKQWGAMLGLTHLSLDSRLTNAAISYLRYLGKTVWPHDLAVPYPPAYGWPAWQVATAALLLAGISFAAIRLVRQRPFFAVGWFWFVGTLLPVIGLVQVGMQSMADRYMYVPQIGLAVVLAWGAVDLLASVRHHRIALGTAAVLVLAGCAVTAHFQIRHWRNGETLFRHTLRVTANNFFAHNNLANILSAQGKFDEAREHYLAALRLNPYYDYAYCNLGHLLVRQARFSEAVTQYAQALGVNPRLVAARVGLGDALARQGQTEAALAHYTEALRLAPHLSEVHNNLGVLLARQAKFAEAVGHYSTALRLNPAYAEAHNNLAALLRSRGETDEAITHLQDALRSNPAHASSHHSLADALMDTGKTDEAIAHYQATVRLDPNSADAHDSLGVALAMQGKFGEAVPHLSEAVRLKPGDSSAYSNLGNALAALGRLDEAIRHYETAVRLNPNDSRCHFNLGRVLTQQGRLDEASPHFAAVLKIKLDDAEAHFHLGAILARQGMRAEAATHFQNALRFKPDYAEAQRELDRLSALPQ